MEGVAGAAVARARVWLSQWRLHWLRRLPGLLKRTVLQVIAHDCLNVARSAAYSAMVALFPALIVAASAVALLPDVTPLKVELGRFFAQVLPSSVQPLLTVYFDRSTRSPHTARTLVVALLVSLTGATSVIATLMEGLRRAAGHADGAWTFFGRRGRALMLAFLSLVPLLCATLLVVFGEFLTRLAAGHLAAGVQLYLIDLALALRWLIALAGVAGVTAMIYHLGTPPPLPRDRAPAPRPGRRARTRSLWTGTFPGAVVATLFWFAATLLFGWYVRRYANYNVVYGSLGAGIALLFWLFLVFLSVLFGAEFNAQLLSMVQHARSVEALAAKK